MTFKDIYESIGESIESYGHHMMSAQEFYASIVDAHTALGELLEQDNKPKRISITINDETILADVQLTIDYMLEDEEITFPNDEAREEFANDCAEEIIDRYENSWDDSIPGMEAIRDIVYDNAEVNGYLK